MDKTEQELRLELSLLKGKNRDLLERNNKLFEEAMSNLDFSIDDIHYLHFWERCVVAILRAGKWSCSPPADIASRAEGFVKIAIERVEKFQKEMKADEELEDFVEKGTYE